MGNRSSLTVHADNPGHQPDFLCDLYLYWLSARIVALFHKAWISNLI